MDIVFSKGIDIKGHIVLVRKQSLDMHLVSYLRYLLGIHGKQCAYVIVSKDTDYDNIINFWKEEGYPNISRKQKISGNLTNKKKTVQTAVDTVPQTADKRISEGKANNFSGDDRSELNIYMQHELAAMGYSGKHANRICKYVVAHCNDERMLSGIYNDLRKEYDDYKDVYADVKTVLEKFIFSKSKNAKRESQVRSFFGQHFKKKIYTDNKEKIIGIIINAKTKQQMNNELMKMYANGSVVTGIYQTIQPLTKDLPGK